MSVEPIEREINRIKKELDSLWDTPGYDPDREEFLEREYKNLRKEQLDGELWYVPF